MRKIRNLSIRHKPKHHINSDMFTEGLKSAIDYSNNKSDSSGVSYSDYYNLYSYVKQIKPQYVLECGTGKSTIVIAQAMLENRQENPSDIRLNDMKLISMEDKKEWYEQSKNNIPNKFEDFVEVHHSPLSTASYSLLTGVIYENKPSYPYDFIFIDGPDQSGGTGITQCDFDFIQYVQQSSKSVSAIIDNRKHTILACTLAFGQDKVSFYPNEALGFVDPVSKNDLIIQDKMIVRNTLFANGMISLKKKSFIK
ncbi:MAG: class I SAM-dependent methyltransferase [Dehalococcoidia bacterium]